MDQTQVARAEFNARTKVLEAAVASAKRTRDNVEKDLSDRAFSLFDEFEGTREPGLFPFDTRQAGSDELNSILEPHIERLKEAQWDLQCHLNEGEDWIEMRAAELCRQLALVE